MIFDNLSIFLSFLKHISCIDDLRQFFLLQSAFCNLDSTLMLILPVREASLPLIVPIEFNLLSLVLLLQVFIKFVHLFDFSVLIFFPPLVVLGHFLHQEVLSLLETLRNCMQGLINVCLLLLEPLNILSHLVDTNLEPVILSVLIIHSK